MARQHRKGLPGATSVAPESLKGLLGEKWFPGAEEIYNAGLVNNARELATLSDQEKENRINRASEILNKPSLKDRFKNFFKGVGSELKKAALGTEGEVKRISTLTPEQESFLKDYLGLIKEELPSELQYLKQLRETPILEQGFGQYAPYAGALGGTLLGSLAAQPSSAFPSGEFGGGSNLQAQLLSSLLGSLIGQSPTAQQYAQSGAQQLGQYGSQLGGYLQQRGGSALDYLRNLAGR